jgi:hypothetical protein
MGLSSSLVAFAIVALAAAAIGVILEYCIHAIH